MGTTAIYGWEYPDSTDAPNVPLYVKTAIEDIEPTVDAIDDRVTAVEASYARGIVKRHRRTTSSSGSTSTTAVPVIRLDNISMLAGRCYRITTGTVHPTSTVTTDTIRIEIRYNTAGVATASSTVMPNAQVYEGWGNTSQIDTVFVPGSNLTISLILCVARETGTGTATLFADSIRRIELMVFDEGLDTGPTGGTNL